VRLTCRVSLSCVCYCKETQYTAVLWQARRAGVAHELPGSKSSLWAYVTHNLNPRAAAAVAAGLALLVWQQTQNGAPSLAAMAGDAPAILARAPRRNAVLVFGASGKLGRQVVLQVNPPALLWHPCTSFAGNTQRMPQGPAGSTVTHVRLLCVPAYCWTV